MIDLNKIYIKKIKITNRLIKKFIEITGDKNPIHYKIDSAKEAGFSKPIAHGMLTSSFMSNVIGNQVPGFGSTWIDTSITFFNPAFANDLLEFRTKVSKYSASSNLVYLKTEVFNQNNIKILECFSTVKTKKTFSKVLKTNNINQNKTKDKSLLIVGYSPEILKILIKKNIKVYKKIIITYNNKKPILPNIKNKIILLKLNLKNNFDRKLKKVINRYNIKIKALIFLASGKISFNSSLETSEEQILEQIKVQAIGFFKIIRSLKENLIINKTSIVVIGSEVLTNKPPKKMLAYVTGKHALNAIAKVMANELGGYEIRVNVISPGIIENSNLNFPEFAKENFRVESALGRLINPLDVCEMINFLISNKSKNITGQNFKINAGYTFS
jgi:acyl dehydratase/enoyl-[acyl-carrier-protein] reductase (NADH)